MPRSYRATYLDTETIDRLIKKTTPPPKKKKKKKTHKINYTPTIHYVIMMAAVVAILSILY